MACFRYIIVNTLHEVIPRIIIIIIIMHEMGGACRACGGEERRIQGFDGET
jgi:hypothetical protein